MPSRYGVKIRKQHDKMTARTRATYACPKCGKQAVRREGFALWQCSSCGAKFAGGAYAPETMVGAAAKRVVRAAKGPAAAQVEEELPEESEQESEEEAEETMEASGQEQGQDE